MRRFSLIALLVLSLSLPAAAFAKKTTYIVTNKRLNYVKLVEVKPVVSEELSMTHPVDIPVEKMRDILRSIKLSKAHLIGDKVDTKDVFDERAINYLAPALSRAFREAKSNEEVQFSYVVKKPLVILRNDRLTMVDAWVSGNEMFLQFKKLYAKMTGDTDKRGNYSRAISRARGLRISLELRPGQQMASVGSDTLVIDLKHNFALTAEPTATEEATTSSATAEETTEKKVSRSKKTKYSRNKTGSDASKATSTTESTTTAASAATTGGAVSSSSSGESVVERLEKLDTLKKRKLISNKEYNQKKKEILDDL